MLTFTAYLQYNDAIHILFKTFFTPNYPLLEKVDFYYFKSGNTITLPVPSYITANEDAERVIALAGMSS